MKKILLATGLLLLSACSLTPQAEEEVAFIRETRGVLEAQREEQLDARKEVASTLSDMKAQLHEMQAQIDTGETVDQEQFEELSDQVEDLVEQTEEIDTVIGAIDDAIDANEASEAATVARDKGEQARSWYELVALVVGTVGGGGALGKLLQKFGPSRSAEAVTALQAELSALKMAMTAIENSPSRASEEVGELREKIAALEGLLAAFNAGYQTPPPGSYPGPGDTVTGAPA